MEALEYSETCRLYWSPEYITNNWDEASATITLPTNFPTSKAIVWVNDYQITNITIRFDVSWIPGRTFELAVYPRAWASDYTRDLTIAVGDVNVYKVSNPGHHRKAMLQFDPVTGEWMASCETLTSHSYAFDAEGTRLSAPEDWPSTVEEWLALQPERPSP